MRACGGDLATRFGHIDRMYKTTESPWATVIISAAHRRGSLTEFGGVRTCTGRQQNAIGFSRYFDRPQPKRPGDYHENALVKSTCASRTRILAIAKRRLPGGAAAKGRLHRESFLIAFPMVTVTSRGTRSPLRGATCGIYAERAYPAVCILGHQLGWADTVCVAAPGSGGDMLPVVVSWLASC